MARSFISTLLLTCALGLLTTPASAGPQMGPSMIGKGSEAVAVVEVKLLSRTARLSVVEWLIGQPGDALKAETLRSWIGICVPGRETLKNMVIRHAHFESGHALRKEALRKGRYRTLVFLRRRGGALRPWCEVETLFARQWTNHKEHAAWRKAILEAASPRPAKPAPPPSNVPTTPPNAPSDAATATARDAGPTPPPATSRDGDVIEP